MPKELYLYSPIYDFVAQDLIQAIEDNSDEDITLRINSPGGGVFANYGICAKATEHGNITAKVDGAAMSSATNLLLYVKKAEALDVSTFVLHRADMYVETPEQQAFLDRINKDLRAKMLKKLNADKFKEITGLSIDDLFDSEKRIDVTLNAKQAKQIGLIQKINVLTPAEVTAFNNKLFAVAAVVEEDKSKTKNMTIEQFKKDHPEVFAMAVAQGVEAGKKAEKDRVEACLVFLELDAVGVKAAIESGENLSAKQMAEFSLKANSPEKLEALKKEGETTVTTTEVAATKEAQEAKAASDAMAGVISLVKLKVNS